MICVVKILRQFKPDKYWNYNVLAQCRCGKKWIVRRKALQSGNTQTCGCIRRKAAYYNRRLYKVWTMMKQRCTNHKFTQWKDYGGRGIKVCQRWMTSFESFLSDMGPCPEGFTLDRINNNGNYTPLNCRWASRHQQQLNRRK